MRIFPFHRTLLAISCLALFACTKTIPQSVSTIVDAGVEAANTAANHTQDQAAKEALKQCAKNLKMCEASCIDAIKEEKDKSWNNGFTFGIVSGVLGLFVLVFLGLFLYNKLK